MRPAYALSPTRIGVLLVLGCIAGGMRLDAAEFSKMRLTHSGERRNAELTISGEVTWETGDDRTEGGWDLMFEFFGVDDESRERLHVAAMAVEETSAESATFSISVPNTDRLFDEDKGGVGARFDEVSALVKLRYFEPGASSGRPVAVIWTNQVQGRF